MARLAALAALLWCGGFLWFSLTLPPPALKSIHTDAVVVLTGGAGRLKRGLSVLEAASARRMLVSGVDRGTTRKQLAGAGGISKARLRTTDLGYEAVDTRSNAEETARWVVHNKFESIRLVTSAGHMRRARMELAQALPAGVSVLPDAVPVEPKAPTIATEYSKYLLRRFALLTGAA
ncbi:MAG: YdcF family protein [Sandarakinorhabdus sp.]|nr:YdcF family protein [Sandarakinorhabdus sp.]